MTTMTNDDDGGDGATGDNNDDDDDGGDNDNGDGATGDGSWICCRRVLKNSQTDHALTIVAHTMTAKLISEEGCSTLCLCVGHFMSTILGQNARYVFQHIVLYVFVFLCFQECSNINITQLRYFDSTYVMEHS